jgi:hypothetical protein
MLGVSYMTFLRFFCAGGSFPFDDLGEALQRSVGLAVAQVDL